MRTKRLWLPITLAGTVLLLAGCIGDGEDRVLRIEATGAVEGLVYFDANGNRDLDPADSPLPNVGVRLLVRMTPDTAARAITDDNGSFSISAVAGTYDIAVAPSTIGDSVQVVEIDPPEISVERGDTVASLIAVSFAEVSVDEARALPLGERVFVEGVALNAQSSFGDQTVHILGGGATIRATQVRSAVVFAGDSLRLLGTTATLDGQRTIDDAEVFILSAVEPPGPVRTTTAGAASAGGGNLDAAFVEVTDATILSVDRPADQDGILTVTDGSGELEVLLDKDVPFTNLDSFIVGTVIDAAGLLVPTGAGTGIWRLKPRGNQDLAIK